MKCFSLLYSFAALSSAFALNSEPKDLDDIAVERELQVVVGTCLKADVDSAVDKLNTDFTGDIFVPVTITDSAYPVSHFVVNAADVAADTSLWSSAGMSGSFGLTYAGADFTLSCNEGDPTCNVLQSTEGGRRLFGCSCFCFSGHSKIDTKDKGTILMKDLKVGDQVLAANGDFQPVYSFMHYHQTKPVEFLQFHLAGLKSKDHLEITSDHLLFVASQANPVPAAQVKVGDKVVVARDNSVAVVSNIKKVMREGLYAPVTPDGTLVVNDLKASSFVTFQDTESLEIGGYKVMPYHLLGHMWEMPHRLFCSSRGGSKYCKSEMHDEDGYNKWTYLGIRILKGAEELNVIFQVILLVVAMSILVPLYAMEWLVSSAPGALFASAIIVATWYYLKKHFTTNVKALKTVD